MKLLLLPILIFLISLIPIDLNSEEYTTKEYLADLEELETPLEVLSYQDEYEEKKESYDMKNVMKDFNRAPIYSILKNHYKSYKESSSEEHMGIVFYTFALIVVSWTFTFVWGIILYFLTFPISFIFRNKDIIATIFIRVIGYYLWTSTFSLFALEFLGDYKYEFAKSCLYIIAGEAVICFSYFGGLKDYMRRIYSEYNNPRFLYKLLNQRELVFRFSFYSILASMLLFIVGIYIPKIVINSITIFLKIAIFWVLNLPIINIIILIISALTFLNFILIVLNAFLDLVSKSNYSKIFI